MPWRPTEPATLVELALKRHGHIDALVNNDAYPALRAPLGEARLEDYRAALEAMAVAPFRLVQLVAPSMRKRKSGRIVFVSSAAPLRGIANYAPYVSARAAANGLVSSLAKELGRDGITVNAVGSNYVENPDYFPPALLANQEAMAKMTAQIPLGRLGKSDELGRGDLLPLLRRRGLHHRPCSAACRRMGVTRAREPATLSASKRRARLTEARLPGSDVQTRR